MNSMERNFSEIHVKFPKCSSMADIQISWYANVIYSLIWIILLDDKRKKYVFFKKQKSYLNTLKLVVNYARKK